ncbi:hypothetical protein RKD47_000604 [Streptomyces albogriseolus]
MLHHQQAVRGPDAAPGNSSPPNRCVQAATGSSRDSSATAERRSRASPNSGTATSASHGRNVSSRLPSRPGELGTTPWNVSSPAVSTAHTTSTRPRSP